MLNRESNFDEKGLGIGTSAYYAKKNNLAIHTSKIEDVKQLDSAARLYGNDKALVLWLGNSQLHGINQYKEGDRSSADYLYDDLFEKNKFLVAFSLPNANLQEHYVLLQYLQEKLPIRQLILPVFYDDTREDGIRDQLICTDIKNVILSKNPQSIVDTVIRKYFSNQSASVDELDPNMKALRMTTQERVEKFLNQKMDSASTIWTSRADLRSVILYEYLYKLRNSIFQISPNTKRKMIPARYELNIGAFKRITEFCRDKKISLLVYIPPIRDDVEQPYIENEYKQFKSTIQEIKATNNFALLNVESIVPAKYWGLKASTSNSKEKFEIDFMHFQSSGHRLLADTIKQYFKK